MPVPLPTAAEVDGAVDPGGDGTDEGSGGDGDGDGDDDGEMLVIGAVVGACALAGALALMCGCRGRGAAAHKTWHERGGNGGGGEAAQHDGDRMTAPYMDNPLHRDSDRASAASNHAAAVEPVVVAADAHFVARPPPAAPQPELVPLTTAWEEHVDPSTAHKCVRHRALS